MQYISAEEFLKQSEKVQKSILNWWKPQVGDLFLEDYWNEDSEINIVGCVPINKEHFEDYNGKTHYKTKNVIPLLTEGQLRQFIEFLTNGYIETEYDSQTGYDIKIFTDKPYKLKYNFIDYGTDYLHALWQVACKIAGSHI